MIHQILSTEKIGNLFNLIESSTEIDTAEDNRPHTTINETGTMDHSLD